MAVSDVTPRIQYLASNGQDTFAYTFKIFSDGDLDVYLTPAGQPSDPSADILALNVDYTVTGVGLDEGGNVVLTNPATLDDVITIERDITEDRLPSFDFQVNGTFTAEQLNENLDKQVMISQQNESLIKSRGLLYPATDVIDEGNTTLPKLGSGQIWVANSSGNLVAADLNDCSDCTTLRSELSSQTPTAPGTTTSNE